ncbi:MAG TPA: glutamate synthase subunit beta [Candidatus Dormibacteraeota bacterium]|nr:glutamate synthase subunit beta [Candidatus Dormibacteraeota bacterium]
MADPLAFVRHGRQLGPDRPVAERLADYQEVHQGLPPADLQLQAGRCMNCSIPFCHHACPLHNLIPDWNALVGRDSWEAALERLHRTNNFPEFTGRVCPAPCEASCVLAINDEPVTIKEVERSLIDRGYQEGWVTPCPPTSKSGRSVAIVGSGPAGLAAAQQLARSGHEVVVFEQADRPGGLLRYGIPDYKLPKGLVDRRVAQMEAEGVTFRCSVKVGENVAAAELRDSFDAVGLALGARRPRELPIPGRDLPGIHLAMEYLEQQNRRRAGLCLSPGTTPISAAGRRVVILGGGDTGADCLGNAHREGCTTVDQLELLPRPPLHRAPDNPWPEWPLVLRVSPAHEEGGRRGFSVETVAFSSDQGRVSALQIRQVRSVVAPGGSRSLEPVPDTDSSIGADLVLLALGFTGADADPIVAELQVEELPGGRLVVGADSQTNVPGVFAFGDAVRGASLVVQAIADGRLAAAAIEAALIARAD